MFITKKNKNCFRRQAKVQNEMAISTKTVEIVKDVDPIIVEENKPVEETKKKTTRVKKEIPTEAVVTEINNEDKETK